MALIDTTWMAHVRIRRTWRDYYSDLAESIRNQLGGEPYDGGTPW